MNVFYPYSENIDWKNSIFLAGPCPREKEDFSSDWRLEAIELLKKEGFSGNVLNPTNNKYEDMGSEAYVTQLDWEKKGMTCASVILFWIPRSERHPALTTNIEFGMWIGSGKCVVGFPEWAEKCKYIEEVTKLKGSQCHNTLKGAVNEAFGRFGRKATFFFTSDTHFSQERTLDLSRRPFSSVNEMDEAMISNWNSRVTMNDTVYHLGDFGNHEIVKLLNFKRMVLVKGNYDRDNAELEKTFLDDGRIEIADSCKCTTSDRENKFVFRLMHEPLSGRLNEGEFALYGHVHRSSVVKRNGLNVGVDGNHYRLFSLDDVLWQVNGILNHYDENVFTEECK